VKPIKTYFLLLLLFTSNFSWGQNSMLTPEEKAILYHVVLKSPTLNRNLGEYFNYAGDTVYFLYKRKGEMQRDSIIDYDSIEQVVIYEPSLLEVNFNEIKKTSQGLLSEVATKMALQTTYRELKRRDEVKIEGISDSVYVNFLRELSSNLPDKAVRIKNGKRIPISEIMDVLDPNIIFNNRVKELNNLKNFKLVEQQEIVNVISESIRSFIQNKSYEYFLKIGGKSGFYKSILLSAGDGSGTAGLLDENELLRGNKHSLGNPKGIGLFTYDTKIVSGDQNMQSIVANQTTIREFETNRQGYTNLHFSMWGFNSRQQSTVVVTREGQSYLFYASKLSKELSPDSTFGNGQTLHTNIKRLEFNSIPFVDNEINGKEGLKYWVEHYTEALAEKLLQIKETEFELDENRYAQNKNQKKIGFLQERLSALYNRKPQIEKQLIRSKEELAVEQKRLKAFKFRLAELKMFLGAFQMEYSKFGFVYTFKDGCTFNAFTQNFVIPDSLKSESFDVRVITIGLDATSEHVDEVQLQVGVTTGMPEDKLANDFYLEFDDAFASDEFELDNFSLNPVELYEVSKQLHSNYVHGGDVNLDLIANGIGEVRGGELISSAGKELDNYPGDTHKEKMNSMRKQEFSELRHASLSFAMEENNLTLKVSSFTDPVKSDFSKKHIVAKRLKDKYPTLSENELLSVFRTFYISESFIGELLRAVYFNFEGKTKTKMLFLLKRKLEKSVVNVKSITVDYSEYAGVVHSNVDLYTLLLEKFKKQEEIDKDLMGI
jgi:hypothetical protein